jgi:hypothetical protein
MLTLSRQARSPIFDIVSAEWREIDHSDELAVPTETVSEFKINVGTPGNPKIEREILAQNWTTCTPVNSEGFHGPGPWKHSTMPHGFLRTSDPWKLWNYVSQKYKGQERQVLKVKKHYSKSGGCRWELVFVAPKAPVVQARAQAVDSSRRLSTGSKASGVAVGSNKRGLK